MCCLVTVNWCQITDTTIYQSCQGYITDLSQAIRPDDLLRLPTPTSIAIVGCGDPGLIDFYATETGCSFPIYADPTGKLYNELGMSKNLALGPQPGYIHKGILRTAGESMLKALKHISTGLILKGGESRQNGGELIYESTGGAQEKQMTWCHRMKTTRDHIEIDELIGLLDPSRQYLKQSKE